MASTRNYPEQFARGTTLDATRIERNIEAQDALQAVPPHLTERRFHPSWLVWGYSPDQVVAAPQMLPWMRESGAISATYPIPTERNPFRNKGIFAPGISPGVGINQNLLTWEVSFHTTKPVYITKLFAFLAIDATYNNGTTYGVPTPPTKANGQSLNDFEFQLFVDDALDPEMRLRTSVEAGSFQQPFSQNVISANPVLLGWDTMQPPHPIGPANGVCFQVDCQVNLPAGRIRIAATIPRYDPAVYTTGWGGLNPQQQQVFSMGVKLSEGCDA